MTINGLIFIVFILGIAAFGLYAAYHREDKDHNKHHFKIGSKQV